MTEKTRLWLRLGFGSAAAGMMGVILAVGVTWPENSLGAYLKLQRDQAEIIQALEGRIRAEPDPLERAFYQAWLAEERGDLAGANAGFREVRSRTAEAGALYVRASMRLGQNYGRSGEPERELALYRSLEDRHPGASRLGQIFFHLRRHEQGAALAVLEDALARDARDGSLGHYRQTARQIRDELRAAETRPSPAGTATGR